MSTIVYLHGFGSSGVSPKSDALVEVFGSDSVLRPDLPFTPDELVSEVTTLVHSRQDFPVIFVGTSLGGFWANYFAQKFDAPCVIVNPSVFPDRTMKARIDTSPVNLETGEPILITQEAIAAFTKYREEAETLYNGALVNVFLAKNDEVLDYRIAESYFRFSRSMTVTETGNHRFSEGWGAVVDAVQKLAAAK